ncbi:MAG: methyltransferase domain-containing protein [Pseudomonadota bacterium]
MLASREDCLAILRCPKTKSPLSPEGEGRLVCAGGADTEKHAYPLVNGLPVVVDFPNSVLSEKETLAQAAKSVVERKDYRGISGVIKHLLSPPKASTKNNVAQLVETFSGRDEPARVLIIGGGSVGQGMAPLYDHPSIKVFGFDIYASPLVQFVADAHQIPLPDDYFDGVVIQAVLEHTLQPHIVVDEIWRVLKGDGVVYAETPFMQQVHEAAYDFTRFSESGHRFLFRNFDLIASGASGGPGRTFMWAADYLARGVFRSRTAGKLAKLAVFWAQYLDNLIPERYAVDGASGVYFYGRKAARSISADEVIRHYKGAQ